MRQGAGPKPPPAAFMERVRRLLVVLILAIVCGMASGGETYPLDRTLKLDVWGGGLEDVAAEIRRQTGVELVFFRPDFPPDKEKKAVYLITGNVSLRLVMECLARRFGCRYRLSESGRLEMSVGYDWVGSAFVVRFNDLEGLLPAAGDASAQATGFREFLRVLPLLSGNFSFNVEESPAPGGGRSAKAVTILPPLLADYFDKVIRCLKGDSGDFPQTGGPDPRAPRAVEAEHAPWNQLLAAELEIPAGISDPRTVMREICARVDIALMLGGNPGGGSPSGLLAGSTGFGRATEELAGILGLPRRVFLNPGAVIFESGKPGEWEEDSGSREFFWSGLAVAGFDARNLVNTGGINVWLARMRREVFPQVWLDPMCAMGYNQVTGRLAIVAPANVVAAVAAELPAPDGAPRR